MRGPSWKKIQNAAKVTGDTVPPQETTVKVPLQSFIQIEFKKINLLLISKYNSC
ncbi:MULTISPECIES: hypothetical protein [Bacillus cereus group]|uniref:hypothetical protein n=1 Tax=Bacillus cereus group TaxID=86661 RepID=UPI000B326F65|nr:MULTISPECIES: hypothetical protein [Bacillus cereus group]